MCAHPAFEAHRAAFGSNARSVVARTLSAGPESGRNFKAPEKMTTYDHRRVESPVPGVLIMGDDAPGSARRWIVRLMRYGPRNPPPQMVYIGIGVVVNEQWILTAAHVVATLQEARRTGVVLLDGTTVIQDGMGFDGGLRWFDDVVPGLADMAALHVRDDFADQLADRQAPIAWNFNPARNIGANTTTFGFLPNTLTLGRANGTIRGTRPSAAPYLGRAIVTSEEEGETDPGDSGAPVLANVTGRDGLQVVGIHTGTGHPRPGAGPRPNRQVWAPLNQELTLRRNITRRPTQVTLQPAANGTVATCSVPPDTNM